MNPSGGVGFCRSFRRELGGFGELAVLEDGDGR